MNRKRVLTISLLVLAIVVLPTVGYLTARSFQSPAQRFASAQPPTPSVLTSTVKNELLTNTFQAQGQVIPQNSFALSTNITIPGATQSVVTQVPLKVGDTVYNGETLIGISGTPIFVLAGAIPAYRDLHPGLIGPDVLELQSALASLGFNVSGDPPSTFGLATEAAVEALYKRAQYPFDQTSPDALFQISQQQTLVDQAKAALALAEATLSGSATVATTNSSSTNVTSQNNSQVVSAQNTLDQAQTSLLHLQETTGVLVPEVSMFFVSQLPTKVAQELATVGENLSNNAASAATPQGASSQPVTGSSAQPSVPGISTVPLVTLTSDNLVVSTNINPTNLVGAKVGQHASISNGISPAIPVVISSISSTLSSDSVSGTPGYEVLLSGVEPIPLSMLGAAVEITFSTPLQSTMHLMVPISAISSRADGTTFVTRVTSSISEEVTVTILASANGMAAIVPKVTGSLADGDRVLIGIN